MGYVDDVMLNEAMKKSTLMDAVTFLASQAQAKENAAQLNVS